MKEDEKEIVYVLGGNVGDSKVLRFLNVVGTLLVWIVTIFCLSSIPLVMCMGYDGNECVDMCGLGDVERCDWFSVKCNVKENQTKGN